MKDILISDFTDTAFMQAFKSYFEELGIKVNDWDGLFKEMNDGNNNRAYVRYTDNGDLVGFIQFVSMVMKNWFFEENLGFIREFWIHGAHRGSGNGSALIKLAEKYFIDSGISKVILTTDTAPEFYIKQGYRRDKNIIAKNNDDVYVKELGD